MSEELWLALTGSVEPSPCLGGLTPQSFELLHRPSDEMFVDARRDGIQLGAVEGALVVEPASDLGVDGPVGAHYSVVGVDQGFRASSWDQQSVRDSG